MFFEPAADFALALSFAVIDVFGTCKHQLNWLDFIAYSCTSENLSENECVVSQRNKRVLLFFQWPLDVHPFYQESVFYDNCLFFRAITEMFRTFSGLERSSARTPFLSDSVLPESEEGRGRFASVLVFAEASCLRLWEVSGSGSPRCFDSLALKSSGRYSETTPCAYFR